MSGRRLLSASRVVIHRIHYFFLFAVERIFFILSPMPRKFVRVKVRQMFSPNDAETRGLSNLNFIVNFFLFFFCFCSFLLSLFFFFYRRKNQNFWTKRKINFNNSICNKSVNVFLRTSISPRRSLSRVDIFMPITFFHVIIYKQEQGIIILFNSRFSLSIYQRWLRY